MPKTRQQIINDYAIKAYTKFGIPLNIAKEAIQMDRNTQHKFIMNYAKEHNLDEEALDLIITNDEEHSLDALPKSVLIEALDSLESIGIFIINEKKDYVYCNKALENISGCPREFILGLHSNNEKLIHCDGVDPISAKPQISFFMDVNNYISGNYYRQITTITSTKTDGNKDSYKLCLLERVPDLEKRIIEAESYSINSQSWASSDSTEIIYKSSTMDAVRQLAESAAKSTAPILICGESGVGKEILVQHIHKKQQKNTPLVDINCAAIPENLLEAELFGYERGAFTGANASGKKGLIENANGGILFLDEINSMPLSIQGKLLRTLETKKIRRIGGTENIDVDFRLICASNDDLDAMIAKGSFRADFYYRINVISIVIPPLRERHDDIVPLARVFLARFCKSYGVNKILSKKSESLLCEYDWPGNVRELRNVIERAVVLSPPNDLEIKPENIALKIKPKDSNAFNVEINTSNEDFSLQNTLDGIERKILQKAHDEGKDTRTIAKELKVNQSTVVRKMQKYGIH